MSGRERVRNFKRYEPGFDLRVDPSNQFEASLQDGEAGQQIVADILGLAGADIEVKTDHKALLTGNVFIETKQAPRNSTEWKLSGINVTTAEYWAFLLDNDVVILAPSHHVHELIDGHPEVKQLLDASNPAVGVKLPLTNLLGVQKIFKRRRESRELEPVSIFE